MTSKKQVKYAQKMREAGFITVRSWIPAEKEDELKRITQAWRKEEREAGDAKTGQ